MEQLLKLNSENKLKLVKGGYVQDRIDTRDYVYKIDRINRNTTSSCVNTQGSDAPRAGSRGARMLCIECRVQCTSIPKHKVK